MPISHNHQIGRLFLLLWAAACNNLGAVPLLFPAFLQPLFVKIMGFWQSRDWTRRNGEQQQGRGGAVIQRKDVVSQSPMTGPPSICDWPELGQQRVRGNACSSSFSQNAANRLNCSLGQARQLLSNSNQYSSHSIHSNECANRNPT